MPRVKNISVILAKEFTKHAVLENDEENELAKLFPDLHDRKIAREIYKMRMVMLWSKSKIAKVMSVDPRTIERFFGTLSLSEYFKMRFQQRLEQPQTQEIETQELAERSSAEFQLANLKRVKSKMTAVLNGITEDKIYDSTLEEAASAYKKLFDTYRLESGQSTENTKSLVLNFDANAIREDAKILDELKTQYNKLQDLIKERKDKPQDVVVNAEIIDEQEGAKEDF